MHWHRCKALYYSSLQYLHPTCHHLHTRETTTLYQHLLLHEHRLTQRYQRSVRATDAFDVLISANANK